MPIRLEDDQQCYVCGKENAQGLRLDFDHSQAGVLKAVVVFSKHHQGYKGIVHGGMIGMVLDEMVVNLAWMERFPVVTVELNVRLKKAAKVGERVLLEGRLGEEKNRLLEGRSTAKNEAGELLAEATVRCMRIKSPDTDRA